MKKAGQLVRLVLFGSTGATLFITVLFLLKLDEVFQYQQVIKA
jgi:hypothetical protein